MTVEGRKPHLMMDVLKGCRERALGPLTEKGWEEVLELRKAIAMRDTAFRSVLAENPELAKKFARERDEDEVSKAATAGCRWRPQGCNALGMLLPLWPASTVAAWAGGALSLAGLVLVPQEGTTRSSCLLIRIVTAA